MGNLRIIFRALSDLQATRMLRGTRLCAGAIKTTPRQPRIPPLLLDTRDSFHTASSLNSALSQIVFQ